MSDDSYLSVSNLNTYYGDSHVLYDISLHVNEHEMVAVLGRNGMGKTTLLNSIMGTVQPRSGSIIFDGTEITEMAVPARSRLGIALVPQGRRILPNLTVKENLKIAGSEATEGWELSDIYELFPRLEERLDQLGLSLSGGEQQMLAISRALLQNPRLLLLDEPFEGLAPKIVELLLDRLETISNDDITVLIVGQQIEETLQLSDRSYILEDGRIVYENTAKTLLDDSEAQQHWLGVG